MVTAQKSSHLKKSIPSFLFDLARKEHQDEYLKFVSHYINITDIRDNQHLKSTPRLKFIHDGPLPVIFFSPHFKGRSVKYSNVQGIFEVTFPESKVWIATWEVSSPSHARWITYIVGTDQGVKDLLKFQRSRMKAQKKPKNGIYRAFLDQATKRVLYEKPEKGYSGKVVHPNYEEALQDVEEFFKDPASYARYGQSAFRKQLLIGPPGTGKTSIARKLAEIYGKRMPVIFADDFGTIYKHMRLCAKYKLPTLILMDDAEEKLSGGGVLNFLSGIDTPNVKNGAYVVFSTNMARAIEWRILRRPGRIDKMTLIDNLTGDYALECASLYFGNDYAITEKDVKLFDNTTGAELQELANSCRMMAASRKTEITRSLIKEVKEIIQHKLKEAIDLSDQKFLMGRDKNEKKSVGFRVTPDEIDDEPF